VRRASAPALVLCGWALLLGAWLFGNPPFASPDEGANYIRAVDTRPSHLIDEPAPQQAVGANDLQTASLRHFTYWATIPAGLAPLPVGCYVHDRDKPAACINGFRAPAQATRASTYVGNYQPLPYLFAGAFARRASAPAAAVRLGRLSMALATLLLLAAATFAVWDAAVGMVSLAGLLIAVTPMVLFIGASLNGSALEISAAIAFCACLIRLARDPSRTWWVLLAISGAILALARTSGPIWLVLLAALALVLKPRRIAWLSVLVVLAAVVLNRVWEARHGGGIGLYFKSIPAVIDRAPGEWWRSSSELISGFGWLEYRLPLVYVAWFALGFALIGLALYVSDLRGRILVAGLVVFACLFPMVVWLLVVRQSGFGMQGRYVLPVLVAVPLVAGEMLRRHPARGPGWAVAALPAAVGLLQVIAWYLAARRSAVGVGGPLDFLGQAQWSPPGGWAPWLACAIAGGVLIAASATSPRAPSYSRRRSPRVAASASPPRP
jgi:Predicted membrane protein (DUF2142)